ncbi:hypothetical protein H310_03768, partial [Aphanomyces invadans]
RILKGQGSSRVFDKQRLKVLHGRQVRADVFGTGGLGCCGTLCSEDCPWVTSGGRVVPCA